MTHSEEASPKVAVQLPELFVRVQVEEGERVNEMSPVPEPPEALSDTTSPATPDEGDDSVNVLCDCFANSKAFEVTGVPRLGIENLSLKPAAGMPLSVSPEKVARPLAFVRAVPLTTDPFPVSTVAVT
jgi:hypothetical protein